MNNKYTNKETSKQLKEWGCALYSEHCWLKTHNTFDPSGKKIDWTAEFVKRRLTIATNEYPAYDLLWDVCIKYAKEFFGEEWNTIYKQDYKYVKGLNKYYFEGTRTQMILALIQQNKTKEANEYLLEHTIFNPKNK